MLNFIEWAEKNNLNEWIWSQNIRNPEDIYKDKKTLKYFNQIITDLTLDSNNLIKLDDDGEETDEVVVIPSNVKQALMKFIAAHLYGSKESKSFLRISFHDASVIINFLDSIKHATDKNTIAEKLRIEEPQAFSDWLQSRIPASKDATYQSGYTHSSRLFKRASAKNKIDDKKFFDLVRKADALVGLIRFRKSKISAEVMAAVGDVEKSLLVIKQNLDVEPDENQGQAPRQGLKPKPKNLTDDDETLGVS